MVIPELVFRIDIPQLDFGAGHFQFKVLQIAAVSASLESECQTVYLQSRFLFQCQSLQIDVERILRQRFDDSMNIDVVDFQVIRIQYLWRLRQV